MYRTAPLLHCFVTITYTIHNTYYLLIVLTTSSSFFSFLPWPSPALSMARAYFAGYIVPSLQTTRLLAITKGMCRLLYFTLSRVHIKGAHSIEWHGNHFPSMMQLYKFHRKLGKIHHIHMYEQNNKQIYSWVPSPHWNLKILLLRKILEVHYKRVYLYNSSNFHRKVYFPIVFTKVQFN